MEGGGEETKVEADAYEEERAEEVAVGETMEDGVVKISATWGKHSKRRVNADVHKCTTFCTSSCK